MTMDKRDIDLSDVGFRIEKLESENRGLKRIGGLVAVIGASLLLMGQAKPNRTVEAESFVLRDPQGRLRATLDMWHEAPMLRLYDKSGTWRAWLSLAGNGEPALTFYDAAGNQMVMLAATKDGASLWLNQGAPKTLSMMEAIKQKGGVSLSAMNGGARLYAEDSQGFSVVLGNTELVMPKTGETHQTSAASIVTFDRDGNVLWSAP
jgi:hypothetical protein